MVAEVIINTTAKKLNKTFDYIIPKTMEEQIYIGSKVLVKFGNIKGRFQGCIPENLYIICPVSPG